MNKSQLNKRIAQNVRIFRAKNNYSQEELAVRLKMSQTQVSAIERGVAMPKLITLCKLAKVFGVKLDDLVN